MTLHRPRKRFGQNFLIDQNVIDKIIAVINPQEDQNIVEIGPGLGALTTRLLPLLKRLQVVELDRDLIPKLRTECEGLGDLVIYQADALQFDFDDLLQKDQKLRIVGNLPYNISTPLLFRLLDYATKIKDMHFMLQLEVANRMGAEVGTKDYGRMSIMLQYYCQVKKLFLVSSQSFEPAPKVNSMFISLVPYEKPPYPVKNIQKFSEVLRLSFSQRRKIIRNNLKDNISAADLEKAGIDPGLRPEQIKLKQYVDLVNGC
jgi:16S rRNA (adenine1518-N6/adenine1519-N6)-dimethyltransferase